MTTTPTATATQNANTLTIALHGDLTGRAADAMVPGIIAALTGKRAARLARKAGMAAPVAITAIVVDLSCVTSLGINGASIVRGIYQTTTCPVACLAGSWARTIALITRGAITPA
jgi:hypothetical protein